MVAGGGGGGGGGGGEGDMCAKYPNMNGRITTGGFDNLKPGSAIQKTEKPVVPYQAGDRVEGITGELNGDNLVKQDGTSVPEFNLVIPETPEKPGWTAGLRGDKLAGLETILRLQIRVWGTVQLENGNPVIMVDHWEKVENIGKIEVWQGSLEIGDISGHKGLILTALDGKKYVLQKSLDIPPDVLQVPPASSTGVITVEGVLLPETVLMGFAVISDSMIDNSQRCR